MEFRKEKQRFSIRKYSVGVASVLIATAFYAIQSGNVYANEITNVSIEQSLSKTASSDIETEIGSSSKDLVISDAAKSSDFSNVKSNINDVYSDINNSFAKDEIGINVQSDSVESKALGKIQDNNKLSTEIKVNIEKDNTSNIINSLDSDKNIVKKEVSLLESNIYSPKAKSQEVFEGELVNPELSIEKEGLPQNIIIEKKETEKSNTVKTDSEIKTSEKSPKNNTNIDVEKKINLSTLFDDKKKVVDNLSEIAIAQIIRGSQNIEEAKLELSSWMTAEQIDSSNDYITLILSKLKENGLNIRDENTIKISDSSVGETSFRANSSNTFDSNEVLKKEVKVNKDENGRPISITYTFEYNYKHKQLGGWSRLDWFSMPEQLNPEKITFYTKSERGQKHDQNTFSTQDWQNNSRWINNGVQSSWLENINPKPATSGDKAYSTKVQTSTNSQVITFTKDLSKLSDEDLKNLKGLKYSFGSQSHYVIHRKTKSHVFGDGQIENTELDKAIDEYFKDNNKYNPEGKEQTVEQGKTPNASDSIVDPDKLPKGTKLEFDKPVDTSTVGDKSGKVIVTYPDGSKDEVPVTVKVVDPRKDADKNTPEGKENTVNIGDKPNAKDSLKDPDKLPKGTKLEFDKPVD
ncbi:MAG: Rib/alpha-like domain-containing protein, partial [Streptococcus sp.]|nr:Rib/alpha-like domain-containing protein [Streptococcus sp.]